jgi:hypothetical protein
VNPDGQLRVFPPVVVEAAATARGAGQAALEARSGLQTLRQDTCGFRLEAAVAFTRMRTAWLAELASLADAVSALGDQAEAAAQDYVRTDRSVFTPSAGR